MEGPRADHLVVVGEERPRVVGKEDYSASLQQPCTATKALTRRTSQCEAMPGEEPDHGGRQVSSRGQVLWATGRVEHARTGECVESMFPYHSISPRLLVEHNTQVSPHLETLNSRPILCEVSAEFLGSVCCSLGTT